MKRFMHRMLGGAVAALALALPAQAATVTLADLFGGATITAGDKLFDEFELVFHDSSDFRVFDAGNINVTSLDDGGDDPGPGLLFDILNGEMSIGGDGIYAYIDLSFSFRVSVLPGAGKLIKDNSLDLLGGSLSAEADFGDTGMYIKEWVKDAAGTDLGDKDVEFSYLGAALGGGGITSKLHDEADFAPQSEVWVTKNLLIWASDFADSASLTQFSQRFSQVAAQVPEPASLALVALALAAAGGSAARRRRQG